MNLYHISQDYMGYDTYDSVVVAADSERGAMTLAKDKIYHSSMKVRKIADNTSEPLGLVIASFNAG